MQQNCSEIQNLSQPSGKYDHRGIVQETKICQYWKWYKYKSYFDLEDEMHKLSATIKYKESLRAVNQGFLGQDIQDV